MIYMGKRINDVSLPSSWVGEKVRVSDPVDGWTRSGTKVHEKERERAKKC